MQSSEEKGPAAGPVTVPPLATPLAALMEPEEYRKQRAAHLLRTPQALKWYVRQHGPELVDQGAMLKIANRWMAHADRFDQAILQIGQRMAAAS